MPIRREDVKAKEKIVVPILVTDLPRGTKENFQRPTLRSQGRYAKRAIPRQTNKEKTQIAALRGQGAVAISHDTYIRSPQASEKTINKIKKTLRDKRNRRKR